MKAKEAFDKLMTMDNGDIEKIAHLLPNDAYHGFNGEEVGVNW